VDQTLAFEIGAVFFLVVLFMAGTKVGGVFPKLGKNIKYLLIAGVVGVIAFGGLRWWPQGYAGLMSMFDSSPSTAPTSSTPASRSEPATPARIIVPKHVNPAAGKATEVEYVVKAPPEPAIPEKLAVAPEPAVSEQASTPEKEKRSAKVFKSIGRALHFGRKTNEAHP
jgi:hypothetical protein